MAQFGVLGWQICRVAGGYEPSVRHPALDVSAQITEFENRLGEHDFETGNSLNRILASGS